MKKRMKPILILILAMIMVLTSIPVQTNAAGNARRRGKKQTAQTAVQEDATAAEEEAAPVVEEEAAPAAEEEAAPVTEEEAAPVVEEEAAPAEEPASTEDVEDETAAPVGTEETVNEVAEEETAPAQETEYTVETIEEEEPALEEAEVAYPPASFDSEKVDGVTVHVDAPENALPEGTTMEVSRVNLDAVQDAVDKAEDIEGTVVAAVDITFFNANGEPVEPRTDITVNMTSRKIAKAEAPAVVHVDANADDIEKLNVVAEDVKARTDDDTVIFNADDFSIYAIIDGSTGDGRARATYHFQNADGTPYYFLNTAGVSVDNQILKDGETLENVGIPDVDVSDETFNGWYYWDNENNSYTTQVEFGPVSVTENVDIYIRANIGDVAYLSFYEDAEGTLILDRVQVPVNTQYDISQKSVPSPEAELAFVGWNESAGTNDDGRTAIENTTITVTGNKSFYPVFKSAHWVRFMSAPVGSGATYFAPAFVLAGQSAAGAKPTDDPKWKGHRFLGWSETEDSDYNAENSFTPYNFNQVLNDDVLLYGHWTAADATYTVQFWKQNVTDSKNATTKTYSFASQETRTAVAGSTVSPTNADKNMVSSDPTNYKGFLYNDDKTDSSKTVNADGTTVLNVYYDRQLITFKFYRNGNSTSAPGYNSQYYNTTNGNTRVTVYTGLYGQTLASNGYEWPDVMYDYYYGNNHSSTRGMSFLGEFVPNSYMGNDTEIRFYYSGQRVAVVEFYLQNVDGSYSNTPSATGNGSGGTFGFTEKFEAFNVVQYRRYYQNGNPYDPDWTNCSDGGSISTSTSSGWTTTYLNLAIRYQRKSHKLKYLDSADGTELAGIDPKTVAYEAPLTNYQPDSSFIPQSQTPGKVWDGKWYKDQACEVEFNWNDTMPNADLNVYAGWEDVWFWVKVDPNGGELHGTQATYFWETYGDLVVEYGDITRDYVEDASGTYYYHYDEFNEQDPDGTQPATRLAYYSTDAAGAYSATKYKQENDAYALIGWYDVTDGEANAKPYNFSTPITKNLIIQARWRKVGEYRVAYDTTGYLKDENGSLTESAEVVGTNPPSDSASYADHSDSSILSPLTAPTGYVFVGWYYDEAEKNPGDVFKIDAAKADENKVIHIKPVFQKYEDQPVPVTHIDFYANYKDVVGLPIEGVTADNQGVFSYENIQINKGYDIKSVDDVIAKGTAPVTSYQGYTFLGWAKKADATENELFLKYEEGKFKAQNKTGDWVEVTQVGADEDQSAGGYDNLYAVWQGQFYVYHSGVAGDGNLETIAMNTANMPNGKYDLTQHVTRGTLYGGYYLDYAGKGSYKDDGVAGTGGVKYTGLNGTTSSWSAYETVNGTAMVPHTGETYYIKEVPTYYLLPYYQYTYKKGEKVILDIWMMSAIDDLKYMETGFVISTDREALVYSSFTITTQVGGKSVTFTPSLMFKSKGLESGGKVTVWKGSELLKKETTFNMRPYWKTPDGVKVLGSVERHVSMGNGKVGTGGISKEDEEVGPTIVK